MKTILITGCSSGFGLEIARYFLARDWRVVATMRTPNDCLMPSSDNLLVLPLDVKDQGSIQRAIDAAGQIDVLVNNAGIGTASPFEIGSMATVREVFETNTLGTMAVTQAVLPQFRKRKSGVIVNISSAVTLKSIPLAAAYTASKAAVNAFTECLALELKHFGIRVHVIMPGYSPETSFSENGNQANRMQGFDHTAYAELTKNILDMLSNPGQVTHSRDVAEATWQAATDPSCPLRLPAGADAVEWDKLKHGTLVEQ